MFSNDLQGCSKKQKMLLAPEEDTTAAKGSLADDSSSTKSRDLKVIETNKNELNLCTSNLSSRSSGHASDKVSLSPYC